MNKSSAGCGPGARRPGHAVWPASALRPLTVGAMLALAACSSFGPDTPPTQRALDPLHDDVGGLLIAFDLPRGVGPMPGASALSLAVTGVRTLKAVLVPADVDQLAGRLPPPGNGRAYYVFALAPADQTAIRTAQADARTAGLTAAAVVVSVIPGLCQSASLDPKLITISVLAAAPGGASLAPLIGHRLLADLIGPNGKLPACP